MAQEQSGERGYGGTNRIRNGLTALLRFRYWRVTIALGAVTLAGYLLYRLTRQYSHEAIFASVESFTAERLALVGLFAAASYACLTGFDACAIKYVRRRIPYPYVAMTSFVSLSFGHNIGLSALSSGMIRYRFYSRYGLTVFDLTRVILFCGATVGLGLLALGGFAMSADRELASRALGIDAGMAAWLGAALLCFACGYVVLCGMARRPISIRGKALRLPPLRLAIAQLVLGPLNFALVAACLHQAIGGAQDVPYIAVAAVYVLANVASIISHVPGGLGVIESVVLLLIPGETVIGALIVFRLAYFVLPLILGAAVFAIAEIVRAGGRRAVGPADARPPNADRFAGGLQARRRSD